MQFIRTALNPWGQEVPIGLGWSLIWVAAGLGLVFVIAHALLIPKKKPTREISEEELNSAPEKILRHRLGARAFHWSMTAAMLTLLVTAFAPILGIQFPWVTVHWIAGVFLILTVGYHAYNVFAKQDIRNMWVGRNDLREGAAAVKVALRTPGAKRPLPGKYPVDQKMFHHAATALTLGAAATGVLMMFRVDHFLWPRNEYLLSDQLWGWVYVIHGISGVGLIFLVITHVYFAIRPEKRWMTRSMVFGWIDRGKYFQNHDPTLWRVSGSARATPRSENESRGS